MKMRVSENVKADLFSALEKNADERLRSEGFKRRKGSLVYRRAMAEARHAIVFDSDFFPRYELGAEVHIHPSMQLSIDSVCDATLQLVGGNKLLLANAPEMILNQPIEMAAPKEVHTRWFGSGFSEICDRVDDIVHFMATWLLPLLADLKSPEDLVRIYESKDERIIRQRHWYLFVAGAEVSLGNPEKALAILEQNLGSAGLRKRYSVAFEALRS